MNRKIPFLSDIVHYFGIFYAYAGKKLYVMFAIIACSGVFESLGISIAFPLINLTLKQETDNKYAQMIFKLLEAGGLGANLSGILALLIVFFAIKGVLVVFYSIVSSRLQTQLSKELKRTLCTRFADADYRYFISKPIGYFNNLLSTETDRGVSGLSAYINVIVGMVYIAIYLLSTFLINAQLTAMVIFLSVLVFLSLRKINTYIKKMSGLLSETNAQIQSIIIQMLHHFKYLKATNGFAPVLDQGFERIEKNRDAWLRILICNALPLPLVELLSIIFLSCLIWFYVGFQEKAFGEILVLLVFYWRAFNRIFSFQRMWQRFCALMGSVNVIDRATRELDKNRERNGTHQIGGLTENVRMKNLNYSYGAKQVLKDIDLTISKSQSIGIVGHSGAGKTTLFDLFVGLVELQSGTLQFDGIDYRKIDRAHLRNLFGYVTQEPVIFNDTIANNISLWDQDARNVAEYNAKLKRAAALANCTSFIDECEHGFDTIIGEKGVKLSGGQRQRIAIAREIFKNPQILIFDEATSALDTDSERLIQQSIKAMKGKYTLAIIAHRLSTIKDCDYLYVLSKGRIVEKGTFDTLKSKNGGVFQRMCLEQGL